MPVPEVILVEGPLPAPAPWTVAGAGAVVLFEGVVRPTEDGRHLCGLHYEAYEPMATRELAALSARMIERHSLAGLRVEHSAGRVPAGAVSFRLQVAAAHRQPALAAMAEFIDAMKRDVPIWKTPLWASDPSE